MRSLLHTSLLLPQLNPDPHVTHLTHVTNIMEDLVHTTNAQSAARPSLESAFPPSPSTLIDRTKDFVKEYMSHYDASHDYQHILRVLALAQHILKAEQQSNPSTFYDPITVTLAALLHDVGDHKYPNPSSTTEDPATLAKSTLISLGAPHSQATYVQTIIKSVSYSHEILNPDRVRGVLFQHPELAIVQDADRLDAIGAVGIGRTFTYGGARGCKGMEETIKHFEEKLEKLEGMMKTAEGKRLARERTKKLRIFKGWWLEENALVKGLE